MKLKQFNKRLGDGAWLGVPMDVYQKHPGHSSTMLRVLLESPLTYKRRMDGVIKGDTTDAMAFGSCQHAAIFEHRFDFHIRPDELNGKKWSGNSTECKAWLDAHQDMPVLTTKEATELNAASHYVRNHPKAGKLIRGGHAEVSLIYCGWKARADYLVLDGDTATITDLKTCVDASTAEFGREILNRGYHIQAGWYCKVLKAMGVNCGAFYFIALQKGPQPLVNVWSLSQRAIELGQLECERALGLWDKCTSNDFWPEWSDYDGTDAITPIDLPAWAYPESDEVDASNGEMQPNEL